MRAFVIAGTHSGCGKTTVTLGLLAALRKKGLVVQPFKAGPDFIDSGLHRIATGRASRNLDLWMCGETYVRDCFERHSADADVAVVEGVMGLYDGNLSTAGLAGVLRLPVILVVDAYGMAESAGAVVNGFRKWESAVVAGPVVLKGVVFNRVAGENHFLRLARSVKDVPVLGYLPRNLDFEIPQRHLGLVVAEEDPLTGENLEKLAETVLHHLDLDTLLSSTGSIGRIGPIEDKTAEDKRITIAVASDKAFCFYYPDNLDLLGDSGAEIVFFSPLADKALPPDIDAVYLGGGYPELYAGQLSQNDSMLKSIRGWADSGKPLYAECGGLVYLSRNIRDFEGRTFPMAAVFPFETAMRNGRAHLGYREIVLRDDCILGTAGNRIKGHEFHYSEIIGKDLANIQTSYAVRNGSGDELPAEGYRFRNALASYVHVHFGSNRSLARNFVEFIKKERT